ncbi:MAG: putative Rossmann fold flavoprotein [Candidatus Paceibacteria bacterium]|jgi:predicted Rossmann fold flavoprotein
MKNEFDVAIIGGGPAGMMAASRASARGLSVVLFEKNPKLGKKLSITGGGRCNVTNNKPVVRDMLSQYKDSGKFLFSTFMQHGVEETINWFAERGVAFIEENEGRLFPSTLRAETIKQTLEKELEVQGVEVRSRVEVTGISFNKKDKRFAIGTTNDIFEAASCVVATGGTSRPETGSSGEGFDWLTTLGHTIVPNNMALVPLKVKASWIARLAGVTLPNVKLTLYVNKKKHSAHPGKLLFTHVGVTGPTILNLSSTVGELLEHSTVTIKVDMLPDLDAGEAKERLHSTLSESSNKKLKNALTELVPAAVVTIILDELKIDGDTPGHSVARSERVRLLTALKAFPLLIRGLLGEDKAVVSAGGVTLEEVDFRTMESRVVPGLYLAGDILNINRPSGGYSLQLCWSTGFVAGEYV